MCECCVFECEIRTKSGIFGIYLSERIQFIWNIGLVAFFLNSIKTSLKSYWVGEKKSTFYTAILCVPSIVIVEFQSIEKKKRFTTNKQAMKSTEQPKDMMHIAYMGTGSLRKNIDVIVLKASCWTHECEHLSTQKLLFAIVCMRECALFIAQLLGNFCGKTVVIVYVLDEYAFCYATLFSYCKCNMCYVWLLVGADAIVRHLR